MKTARGSFAIEMTPCQTSESEGGEALARMVLNKTYSGDLAGTARGQMLACTTEVEGSAGYVAFEIVEGEVEGRRGTFVLQHSGTMDRGAAEATVSIVADSGTDELSGISGTLVIENDGGAHSYILDYTLPA